MSSIGCRPILLIALIHLPMESTSEVRQKIIEKNGRLFYDNQKAAASILAGCSRDSGDRRRSTRRSGNIPGTPQFRFWNRRRGPLRQFDPGLDRDLLWHLFLGA